MTERRKPGSVRDAILAAFDGRKGGELTVADIRAIVEEQLGGVVPASSIRSYLNINTPGLFIRTERGQYRRVRK